MFRQLIVVLLGARAVTATNRAKSCPWPQPLSSVGRASDGVQPGLAGDADAGTNRDQSGRMTRSHWWVPIALVCASTACAQSPESQSAGDPAHVADISAGVQARLPAEALALRADS